MVPLKLPRGSGQSQLHLQDQLLKKFSARPVAILPSKGLVRLPPQRTIPSLIFWISKSKNSTQIIQETVQKILMLFALLKDSIPFSQNVARSWILILHTRMIFESGIHYPHILKSQAVLDLPGLWIKPGSPVTIRCGATLLPCMNPLGKLRRKKASQNFQ